MPLRLGPTTVFVALYLVLSDSPRSLRATKDYDAVIKEIETTIDIDLETIAPAMIRLGWHSAATYSAAVKPHGGTNGATMRFKPESQYEENNGLKVARDSLKTIHDLNPDISYSDLWVLAAYVSVKKTGGPDIPFLGGRIDAKNTEGVCPPESRLPVWNQTETSMRDSFARMGLGDRDIVALMGAHTVGHTYPENTGFPYMKWDNTPTKFDNRYYQFVLQQPWQKTEEAGKTFYYNRSWLMLLTDYMLRTDGDFRKIAEEYAADEGLWHADFAKSFKKITELGLNDGCPKLMDPATSCPFAASGTGSGSSRDLPLGHPPVKASLLQA